MLKISRILVIFASFLIFTAMSVNAETYFTANLTGGQEVPPDSSVATGFGRLTLNDAENLITVSVYYGNPTALSGSVITGHIHGGVGVGFNGPVIFDLNPAVGTSSGSVVNATFSVTSNQVADLKAGLWYINIHTNSFPNGEIRGQFYVDSPYISYMDNNQENPPTNVTGTKGSGYLSLNETTNQAILTMNWSGLSGNKVAGQVHWGRVGTNGSTVCELTLTGETSGSVVDQLCLFTPAQVKALKQGQLYLNIQTAANQGGEIRGQIQRRASTVCDYDGDGITDAAIIRANYPQMDWWIRNSSDGSSSTYTFGLYSDFYSRPVVCGDFDGDGKDDLALWRSAASPNAVFYVFQSSNFIVRQEQFGTIGDDPRISEDYDGDGRTDIAVFRQSDGTWNYIGSSNNPNKKVTSVRWGVQYATPGDFDGDGKGDFVDKQGSNFWMFSSRDSSVRVVTFGPNLAFSTPGDYDGDGKTDIGIGFLEGARSVWYYLSSVNPTQNPYITRRDWGGSGAELPVRAQGDYDGDGKTDYAVWKHADLPTETPKFWALPSNGSSPIIIPWGIYTPDTAYPDYPVAGYNHR